MNENLVLNELPSIMGMNKINPRFNIIANTRFGALVKYLAGQGPANAANLAFQFGNFDIGYSNNMTLSADSAYTFFIMPKGSCAFVPWVDRSAEMGEESRTTIWRKQFMSKLGFDVGVKITDGCADNALEAGVGFEASNQIQYVFSFDYSLVTAYNSDPATLPGVIFKADIAES